MLRRRYFAPRRSASLPEWVSISSGARVPVASTAFARRKVSFAGALAVVVRPVPVGDTAGFLAPSRGGQHSFPSGSVFSTSGIIHRGAWKRNCLKVVGGPFMVGLRWRETPRDRAPLRRFLRLADPQFRARQDFSDGLKVIRILGSCSSPCN